MNHTVLLAERYSKFSYDMFTKNALQKTKECIIDYIGCTCAGLSFDSSKIIYNFTLENHARGKCTVIGSKEKLAPIGACLVNSSTGHAPELDDTSMKSGLHVGVVVIPTALAIAENLGLGGKDLLTAIIAGYEMSIKVGQASNPRALLARGYHPTSLCGMFGAAITASRLMGLSPIQTANALGIVGSYVAGNLECYSDGSFTKRLHPGIASSSGVTAAILASKNFTGPKSILEGPRGFFHAYCENPKPETLHIIDGFEIETISFKPYSCCRLNQGPIDGILDICSNHKINYKQIKSIIIELTKTYYDIVGQPADIKFNPKNVVDAQFSAPYSVAIACIEGKAFLEEYSDAAIQRPDVREFMKNIIVKHDADLDNDAPGIYPVRVTVLMNNGERFTKRVEHVKGDPENPFTREDIINKFNTLAQESMLSCEKRIKLIEATDNLENIDSINMFTDLLP